MKYKDCKIVIVRNEFPNRDISALLNHPVYSEFVRYLEGDFMNEKTLMDAMTFESRGVFILSN